MYDSRSSKEICNKLAADASFTATIDTYGGSPAIFADNVFPNDFDGKGVLCYEINTFNGGLEYGDYDISVSCRAKTMSTSRAIQEAAFEALNRLSTVSSNGFMVATPNQTIPPQDSTDSYNSPIDIKLKTRGL